MKKRYTIDELEPGMFVMRDFPITEDIVRDFARVSRDTNPIHLDEEYAKNTRYKRPIVHGMLVASFISSLIATGMPGEGAIYMGQTLSFLKPVYHDDIITVELRVLSVNKQKDFVILSTRCFNKDHVEVVAGEAKVRPGKG